MIRDFFSFHLSVLFHCNLALYPKSTKDAWLYKINRSSELVLNYRMVMSVEKENIFCVYKVALNIECFNVIN